MNGRCVGALRAHRDARRAGLGALQRPHGVLRALHGLPLVFVLLLTGGVDREAAQLNNQANEQYDAANLDEAGKLYDEAQTRAPDSPEIAYNRGNALYRQGRLEDAVRQLLHGTQSTDPDLRRRSFYNLGNALHDLRKLEDAAAAYRHALLIDPLNRDAKINYEKTLDEMGQQEKQPQDSQSKSDKNKQQQQQGQQGQQRQDGQQSDDQQARRGEQQEPQQSGDQRSDEEGEEQQAQSEAPRQQNAEDEARQAAAMDSVAAGNLSPEEAVRILEAMREQERELQRERARKPVRSRRVEKDW